MVGGVAHAAGPARAAGPVRRTAAGRTSDRYAAHACATAASSSSLFVVWHLLDLTFGAVNPAGGDGEPYDKVVADFAPSRWYVTVFYVLAVVMVGLHLRHGLWSALQTLGWDRRRRHRALRRSADAVAAMVIARLPVRAGRWS